jgi:hypothetical protein
MTEEEVRTAYNITAPCCDSCHDDSDDGYDMCFILFPNGDEAEVCCSVAREYDKTKEAK